MENVELTRLWRAFHSRGNSNVGKLDREEVSPLAGMHEVDKYPSNAVDGVGRIMPWDRVIIPMFKILSRGTRVTPCWRWWPQLDRGSCEESPAYRENPDTEIDLYEPKVLPKPPE